MLIAKTDQDDLAIRDTSLLRATSPSSTDSQVICTHQISIHVIPTHVTDNGRPKRDNLIPPLLTYTTNATPGRPTPTIIFPLSPDHQLITLVQYNVVRGMIFNMSILSLLYCLPENCSRTFGVPVLGAVPPERIPLDLQPTLLQQSIPHPFWISAIPFPAMRDNLILLAGTYDSTDLCYDLGQALYEGFDDVERRGCLVWGDPWHMSGWEVSEGFLQKWKILLQGCPDVIEWTNHWREVRGEDKLIMEE